MLERLEEQSSSTSLLRPSLEAGRRDVHPIVPDNSAVSAHTTREDQLELEGVQHPETLNSISNLATVLQDEGKYEAAEKMHRRALEWREKMLGWEHPDTLMSVSNLAGVLWYQGKYEVAVAMNQRALEGREKVLGQKHPDTLTSVSNLALMLQHQGKYEASEAMNRRALEGREKVLGQEDLATLMSVNNLALVLKDQGKYKLAVAMNQRALDGRMKALGPGHTSTLRSLSNLALALKDQGKYGLAEAMSRRALEGRERALGSKHPDTLISLSNLAEVLKCLGKYKEAETMNRRAMKWREKVLGQEHPYTLGSVSNLAEVLQYQGEYEAAVAMNQRALEGREKVLGREHPDTLKSISNLAKVLRDKGEYEVAEAMNRQALKMREKVLGREHPDTLKSISNLALVLQAQGKYEEAEAMNRQALEGREKVLGQEHPDTLESIRNLSQVLQVQGKYEEAEAINRQAMEGREEVLGQEHPDTLKSISNLAQVLRDQGEYGEAEAMNRQALGGKEKVLGRVHLEATYSGLCSEPEALSSQLSVAMLENYQYRPLAYGEFRLIQLDAILHLVGNLVHAKMDSAPAYTALSYAWGDAPPSEAITLILEGKTLAITKNLKEAILSIGDAVQQKGHLLWIDAICINQNNIPERNSQVLTMDLIYKNAQEVRVWLGPSSEESDRGMQGIQYFYSRMLEIFHEEKARHGQFDVREFLHGLDRCTPASLNLHLNHYGVPETELWKDIVHLFERDWWQRAWVVQEATCPVETVFQCGSHQFDWKVLAIFLIIVVEFFTHEEKRAKELTSIVTAGIKFHLVELGRKNLEQEITLLEVLDLLRFQKCRDPRDKVYAARGIAADVGPTQLLPQYQSSIQMVYTDVVRFLIDNSPLHRRLDFLGYAPGPMMRKTVSFTSAIPSWLPDWTCTTNLNPFGKVFGDGSEAGRQVYNASKGRIPEISLSQDGLVATIKGLYVDRISSGRNPWYDDASELLNINEEWVPKNLEDPYPAGGNVRDAWLHTLTADVLLSRGHPIERGVGMQWPINDDHLTAKDPIEARKHGVIINSVKCAINRRQLIYTDHGYMGLAPWDAEVGDWICLFFGSQVLYVLKGDLDRQCEFVGECYLHGMMDGEALGDDEIVEERIKTFTLI